MVVLTGMGQDKAHNAPGNITGSCLRDMCIVLRNFGSEYRVLVGLIHTNMRVQVD